jgi:hypothetical protein
MSPVAHYFDKSPFGRREYDLYPESITVRYSDTLNASGESIIRLMDLNPDYHRVAQRSQFFRSGIWMMMVPWLLYWGIVELTKLDPFGVFPGFFLAMGFAGLFMVFAGGRKQQSVTFQTLAGVPALTIFKEGPNKHEFDSFLKQVVDSIRGMNQTK